MKGPPALGVRKGAWSEAEDILLRNCIEKYGEGKWHQVPLKAGLNRCRKSCRLRWLNYLRPNIKRGEFTQDEVDLIIRLHKLLGNRWSLIAGRIPGRTANDVKNYWNAHMYKKQLLSKPQQNTNETMELATTNIIKPRPRTFSKNLHWLTHSYNNPSADGNRSKQNSLDNNHSIPSPLILGDGIECWDDLFDEKESDGPVGLSHGVSEQNETVTGLWEDQMLVSDENSNQQEGQKGWCDISKDVDLWDLLNFDQSFIP